MTTDAALRRRPSTMIGLACAGIGLLALLVSLPLLMLESSGWPWNGSIASNVEAGTSRAELLHDDGRLETFSGTPDEVDTWVLRREVELKREYGLDRKIQLGHLLSRGGLILLVFGVAVVIGRRVLRPS